MRLSTVGYRAFLVTGNVWKRHKVFSRYIGQSRGYGKAIEWPTMPPPLQLYYTFYLLLHYNTDVPRLSGNWRVNRNERVGEKTSLKPRAFRTIIRRQREFAVIHRYMVDRKWCTEQAQKVVGYDMRSRTLPASTIDRAVARTKDERIIYAELFSASRGQPVERTADCCYYERFTVSLHVQSVITSCAQTSHAPRV